MNIYTNTISFFCNTKETDYWTSLLFNYSFYIIEYTLIINFDSIFIHSLHHFIIISILSSIILKFSYKSTSIHSNTRESVLSEIEGAEALRIKGSERNRLFDSL